MPLAVTRNEGTPVPDDDWSLRTTITTAAVGLEAGRWARFWVGGMVAKLGLGNPYDVYSGIGGNMFPYGWSAGCEIGHEPMSQSGAFLQVRASYLEAPETSHVLLVGDDSETCIDAFTRSSITLLTGRSSLRAAAYCGARVTSARLFRSRDTDVCEFEKQSDVGVVIGVEGKGAGASVFVEAAFRDVPGIMLGMKWSR
ncbi:MAG: hypothetical protein ACYTKD_29370 [Planctomycetota bacterium]